MEKQDFFALLLVCLIAATVFFSTEWIPHLLTDSSYANALEAKAGEAGSFYALVNLVYSRAADLSGVNGFDLGLFLQVVKIIPPIFGMLFAAGVFLALRSTLSREASFVGAILAVASPPCLSVFMANVFLPASMGAALLALGIGLFFYGIKEKKIWFSCISGVLLGLAVNAWPYAIMGFAGFFVVLLAQNAANQLRKMKNKGELLVASLLCISCALTTIGLTGFGNFYILMDFGNVFGSVLLMLPLFAIALVGIALRILNKVEMENSEMDLIAYTAFFVGILVSATSPLAGLLLVAFGAALGAASLLDLSSSNEVVLVSSAAIVALGGYVLLAGFVPTFTAGFLALLLGLGGAALVSMFGGARAGRQAAFLAIAFLVLTSVNMAVIGTHYQSDPISAEMADAIRWIRTNTANGSGLAVASEPEMAGFLSERQVVVNTSETLGFLFSNSSTAQLKEKGVDYLVIDAALWDHIEQAKNETGNQAVRMEAFGSYGYQQGTDGVYHMFVSSNGNAMLLPVDPATGQYLAVDYVVLYDRSGNLRNVPFGEVLQIKDAEGKLYRLVYPYESYQVNLFNAFFGKVNGLTQAYPSKDGRVRIYRVE